MTGQRLEETGRGSGVRTGRPCVNRCISRGWPRGDIPNRWLGGRSVGSAADGRTVSRTLRRGRRFWGWGSLTLRWELLDRWCWRWGCRWAVSSEVCFRCHMDNATWVWVSSRCVSSSRRSRRASPCIWQCCSVASRCTTPAWLVCHSKE